LVIECFVVVNITCLENPSKVASLASQQNYLFKGPVDIFVVL